MTSQALLASGFVAVVRISCSSGRRTWKESGFEADASFLTKMPSRSRMRCLKKSRASQDSPANEQQLDVDALAELLGDVHAEASRDFSHVFAKAASAASLAVASVLCASTERTEEVFRLYAQTQLSWYRGEVRMQPSFFSDWLNWCQGHASNTASAQGKE